MNIIEEYLVSVKPSVDMSQWDSVTGKIKNKLTDAIKGVFTGQFELDDLGKQIAKIQQQIQGGDKSQATADLLKDLQDKYKDQKEHVDGVNKRFQTTVVLLNLFGEAVSYAADEARKLAESSIEASNKFVTQDSMFVDTNIRDIMGKYGVSSQTAMSIDQVSNTLGYDLNEYAKWLPEQREQFARLMQTYKSGIESIDPEKLERFNAATQQYQLQTAEFELKMNVIKTQLLANSESIPRLLDFMTEKLDQIVELTSSEAFQGAFDVFVGIIEGILKFASIPLDFLSFMTGGSTSKSSTTNTDNSRNVTVNAYNQIGTDSSSLAVDIGLQVQNAMTRL